MSLVVLFALEGAALLDVTGPAEAFSTAAAQAGPGKAYHVVVASVDGGLIKTSCGIELMTASAADLDAWDIDTLLVTGGRDGAAQARAISWLASRRVRIRRIGAISGGVLVLAAAGILDHRRATTHWTCHDALRAFDKIEVESDALFVEDGGVWTSAGVSAGIDMALQMIEQDCGLPSALETARDLLLYLKRAGGESQVSPRLQAQSIADNALKRITGWILENPGEDLSTPALARRAHLGLRSLFRAFRDELGMTPREFVVQARLEVAQRFLEQTDHRIDEVAFKSGFSSTESMRRAFKQRLGVPPVAYREQRRAGPLPVLVRSEDEPLLRAWA